MSIINALDATKASLRGRLQTDAATLLRLAEEEAVLVDAQAWMYALHTRLLRSMVAQTGWASIGDAPKHAVAAEDDVLTVDGGATGLLSADTLLAVVTGDTFSAGRKGVRGSGEWVVEAAVLVGDEAVLAFSSFTL